mgnify:CR=1 FL=1
MTEYGFNTMLLHGVKQNDPYGATHTPVYQSSAFRHESAEDLENIFTNKAMGFSYTRINNPTVEAFEQRITKLERGVASVACASGMAALFNALANILQAGDEVVAAAGLYGGTVELFLKIIAGGSIPGLSFPTASDWTPITFDLSEGKASVLEKFPDACSAGGRMRFDIDGTDGAPLYIRAIRIHR